MKNQLQCHVSESGLHLADLSIKINYAAEHEHASDNY